MGTVDWHKNLSGKLQNFFTQTHHILWIGIVIAGLGYSRTQHCMAYDPLVALYTDTHEFRLDVSTEDPDRQVPILLSLPDTKQPVPIILFSHGLGGSREGNSYLRKQWTTRGYACVFLQHPGSDESVWKDLSRLAAFAAAKKAASLENLKLRVSDVQNVLNALEKWNKEKNNPCFKRLMPHSIGMSGHSFGAKTTQYLCGQKNLLIRDALEKRLNAAVIFSPSGPIILTAEAAFGGVTVPWLLMTGTNDIARIGGQTVEDRLSVFPALPKKNKYQLVFHEGTHSTFSDHELRNNSKRNPHHHKVIKAITTAFWDTYLKNNDDAKKWLTGTDASMLLEENDIWQSK